MKKRTLDVRHMLCPLPVLRARKELQKMAAGDILNIEGTDPSSIKEFELFQAEQKNFQITDKKTSDTGWHLTLEKL